MNSYSSNWNTELGPVTNNHFVKNIFSNIPSRTGTFLFVSSSLAFIMMEV